MNSFEEAVDAEDYKNKVFLQFGAPGPATLREVGELMKEATLQQFGNFDDRREETLQYGTTAGYPDFKQELAKYLTSCYRNSVKSQDLFINYGATQGFADLLSYYFQPGDTLFLGDPTYWALLDTIKRSAEINIVPVKIDENGLNIDDLEIEVEKLNSGPATERHPFRAGVYVIPLFQNPTTVCLSPDRCKQLVDLARKHDLLVMCDDVYNILTYSSPECTDPTHAKPPMRLFHYDKKSDPDYKGNVVSIGTFSKLLSPGLRLGWFEMPQRILKDFAKSYVSVSGGGRNPYTSGIVMAGLKSGLVQRHVEKIRFRYAERMKRAHEIICSSLKKHGVKCVLPGGGIFMWIELPGVNSADDVLKQSSAELSFATGKQCSFSGTSENGIRICIAFYEPDVLYPAITNLCKYIVEVINENAK